MKLTDRGKITSNGVTEQGKIIILNSIESQYLILYGLIFKPTIINATVTDNDHIYIEFTL